MGGCHLDPSSTLSGLPVFPADCAGFSWVCGEPGPAGTVLHLSLFSGPCKAPFYVSLSLATPLGQSLLAHGTLRLPNTTAITEQAWGPFTASFCPLLP